MLVGEIAGVVDIHLTTARKLALVHHGGRCGDEVQVILALQPLLHNLHMQQPQEAAPEAESHRAGHLYRHQAGHYYSTPYHGTSRLLAVGAHPCTMVTTQHQHARTGSNSSKIGCAKQPSLGVNDAA